MLIDTHSHLFADAFTDDLEDCITRAKYENVEKIILVGFNNETNEKALSKEHEIFLNTAGIHPSEASEDYQNLVNNLREFVDKNEVYAIGECGLDYYWVKDNKELQKIIFEEQIKLAIEKNLPIIIHMRDATKDTYDILKKYKGQVTGIMHCYSGSYEMALHLICQEIAQIREVTFDYLAEKTTANATKIFNIK